MQIIHLVILFVYIFVLLMLNIPKIGEDESIKQKIYIFIGVFIFEFITSLFTTIYNGCIVNIGKIFRDSLQIALVSVVAYSIYIDLLTTKNQYVIKYNNNPFNRNLTITIIIIFFIAVTYLLEGFFELFSPKMNDCLNDFYRKQSA